MTTGALIASVGWARFREYEANALKKLIEPSPRIVLATGGGTVEREDNRSWLQRTSRCFYLEVPLELLERRMGADPTERPALEGGGDPVAELGSVLERREALYLSVGERIPCGESSPEQVTAAILARL